MVDRSAEAQAHAHSIGTWLRRRSGEAKDEVLRITGEVADLADATASETERVVINARRWLATHPDTPKRGRLARLIDDLESLTATTNKVIVQTRTRVAGDMPAGATRLVSLHEPDARPIRKGRLGRPVEFGYKAQVVDNIDGLVVDHTVEIGNPADAPQLEPAIARIKARAGTPPTAVTADRGYGFARIDKALGELGVTTVAIPRAGKPGAARADLQISDPFIELVKWRTGSEGRISSLKRDYGLRRTRLNGHAGVRTWVGHGVLAHNLTKIARLTA